MAKPLSRNQIYAARLQEVRGKYTGKTVTVHGSIPVYIHKRWKEMKAEGLRRTIGDIMGLSMHFCLFGPHPYYDPIDGLTDAFRVYEEQNHSHREIAVRMIRYLADTFGIDVKINA